MSMFGYYALHSFKNQLRKLLKSWLIILLILIFAFAVGTGIGIGAATLSDDEEDTEYIDEEYEDGEDYDEEEEDGITFEEYAADPDNYGTTYWGDDGLQLVGSDVCITNADLVEAAAGAVILAVLFFCAFSAEKGGSSIFLPADAALLFPSPMRPQSVLLFRLMNQMAASIAGSIYLLAQLPNLTENGGLSLWGALSLFIVWVASLLLGRLLQVFLYTLMSTHERVRRLLRPALYAVLGVIAAGYVLYWKGTGLSPLFAAICYFSAPVGRWIPVWGWLRGICAFAFNGQTLLSVLCLLVCIAFGVLSVFGIWRLKADFYEDALSHTDEVAAAQERKTSSSILAVRKKDRSKKQVERLTSHSVLRGSGAAVFFWKPLLVRRRSAPFGFLTRTCGFYLAAGVLVSGLLWFLSESRPFMPIAILFGIMIFLRSLGNPMHEDTQKPFFFLIPAEHRAKLFCSLLGGTACSALDLLPGYLISAVLLNVTVPDAVLWFAVLLTLDFFATACGTFISLSTPQNAGDIVKNLVQIFLYYLAVLPDILLVFFGTITGMLPVFLAIAVLVNLGLGSAFAAVSPVFLNQG